jgi:endonuclease/exonuclease/phosphatase family metal-dependent hydrolase
MSITAATIARAARCRAFAGAAELSPRRHCGRTLASALFAVLAVVGCARARPPVGDAFAATSNPSCRQAAAGGAAIEWTGPPDPGDVAGLTRWCETVGPVLFQPAPAERSSSAVNRLAIVSWNVHVGSGDVAELVRRLRLGEFTGGEPIEHFVLLLQEAYRRDDAVPAQIPRGLPAPSRIAARTGRGPDVGHIAAALGVAVFYVPSMRNGIASIDAEDRGNAIMSTLPLQRPQVVELPLEHQRRAAAVATVASPESEGPAWRVRLADVHLDTALALTRHGPFAARRRQAVALADALAPSGETATVVGGDFNSWRGPGEPALTFLRALFPQTPTPPAQPTWYGPLGIRAQIDYIFLRGRLASTRVERLPSRFGSDHYPLLAMVRF